MPPEEKKPGIQAGQTPEDEQLDKEQLDKEQLGKEQLGKDRKPRASLKVGASVRCHRYANGATVDSTVGVVKRIGKIGEETVVAVELPAKNGTTIVEGVRRLAGAPEADVIKFGPRYELIEE